MQLSKEIISSLSGKTGVEVPGEAIFSLPEKVIQFGTGVLLRALPDYFIDKANKKGLFKGRIVVVKSTAAGGADAFDKQDGLYTLCVRGLLKGKPIEENSINASISRVLSAATEWEVILNCAANPAMELVISNTTEVGITLVKESILKAPPSSFPAKLLAFLYKRYTVFNGDSDKGLVIVPTELITDNGRKLKEILLELAAYNQLDTAFVQWLTTANHFCNSLVDRIVPGKLSAAEQLKTTATLGYDDDLMIMAEVYRLWAIETDSEKARMVLSFSTADEGVVVTNDITKFKELKLRLLNGSHSFTCALALLQGFTTVKEAMADAAFFTFIRLLMEEEIIPAITSDCITKEEAQLFAHKVLDRYKNPYLEHQWISISVQYTSKMKMRTVPLLQWYMEKKQALPSYMVKGFAAYLLFMRSTKDEKGNYTGIAQNKHYIIQDQYAGILYEKGQRYQDLDFVKEVLRDEELWGTNLLKLEGLADTLYTEINTLRMKYLSEQSIKTT